MKKITSTLKLKNFITVKNDLGIIFKDHFPVFFNQYISNFLSHVLTSLLQDKP